jgi:hypothetical protein
MAESAFQSFIGRIADGPLRSPPFAIGLSTNPNAGRQSLESSGKLSREGAPLVPETPPNR